jgi:predicted DNA-binding WGR domain protein
VLTVRYGRIGGDGQSRAKQLASEEAARQHVACLIAEKAGNGYRSR